MSETLKKPEMPSGRIVKEPGSFAMLAWFICIVVIAILMIAKVKGWIEL